MTDPAQMRALRLHHFGAPGDVLRLEDAPIPVPGPNQVRIRVHACALNPADRAICADFFFGGALPRGIGLDVSGIVDAVGEGVTNAAAGDRVFGVPDFIAGHSAGAAEHAVLMAWARVPEGLGLLEASVLPMAVETGVRSLDLLGLTPGKTILINGGGSMMGFAAVQIALLRGARVIATAGETFAGPLRDLGAKVTPYGAGMVQRVREIAGGPVDLALHAALADGVLPDLIDMVGGDPQRVMSISDFDEGGLGVRTTGREPNLVPRYDALAEYAGQAAQGRFTLPIARTFALEAWREALDLAFSNRARGKVVLLPEEEADSAS
jgi:NADPH:quinone reductase-like Zn-dependent oxidoreductase